MIRSVALAASLVAGGCAAAVDQTMAKLGVAAFEAICFAGDQAQRQAAAKRAYFVPIPTEKAKPVLGDRPAQLWGRRGFTIDTLILEDNALYCEIGVGRASPAQVSIQLREMFARLAAQGATVTPLTNTGTAGRPRQTYRITAATGRESIVFLNSAIEPSDFPTSLLQTERPQDLRASYRLRP